VEERAMPMTLDRENELAAAPAGELIRAGLVLCAPYVTGGRQTGLGEFEPGKSVTVFYDAVSRANGLCFVFIEARAATVKDARALAVTWAKENVPYPHTVRQSR
jgi:hypothetical protein